MSHPQTRSKNNPNRESARVCKDRAVARPSRPQSSKKIRSPLKVIKMRLTNHRAHTSHRPNSLKSCRTCMGASQQRRGSLFSGWARITPVSSPFLSMMMEDNIKKVGCSCVEGRVLRQLEERWAPSTPWKASKKPFSRHWAHSILTSLNRSCSASSCKTLWQSRRWWMRMVTTYCIGQLTTTLSASASSWSPTTSNVWPSISRTMRLNDMASRLQTSSTVKLWIT